MPATAATAELTPAQTAREVMVAPVMALMVPPSLVTEAVPVRPAN